MGKTTVSGSDFPVNQSIEFLGDDKKKRLMDVKIWESSHVWKIKVLNGFDSLTHVKTGTMMGMLAVIYSKNLQQEWGIQHGVVHGVLPKKVNLAANIFQ